MQVKMKVNLYHLGMSSDTHDFPKLFGDVKFVCCGGSSKRMEKLANYFTENLPVNYPYGFKPDNLCHSDRYVMYKVGPVLCVNHGMGHGSISTMLHEVLKLLRMANCKDTIFFRIGTSGGLGLPGGTVVISESVVDDLLEDSFEMHILGKRVRKPTRLDSSLNNELLKIATELNYNAVIGKTLCSNDFYEGQARLDGAFCDYSKEEKLQFLQKAHLKGVKNIEMESSCFSAFCTRANVRAAVICVTLLNRLEQDQIDAVDELEEWEQRPVNVVTQYIAHHFNDAYN
ncbi:Uridine phosphorylase 1 [Trichinella spiralis]|uniref:Uridine phosphorylase 1 n=2 Tax=Trichinella spiralis TaxID=6334 RepID=A0A0V1BSV2_TRISP|nr:Uridine phosphorylase 1 [Trichinella spiralis]